MYAVHPHAEAIDALRDTLKGRGIFAFGTVSVGWASTFLFRRGAFSISQAQQRIVGTHAVSSSRAYGHSDGRR
jgi:hypothetical protein